MADIETMTSNKTFRPMLILVTPEQKELLQRISVITGQAQTALVRTAISMLIGGYKDVLNSGK